MSRKTGAVPARKKSKMRTSNWQFWAIIALPVIYAIVFAYIPMGGIVIAFKDYSIRKGIFGSDWVGLKYFKQFLTSTSSVTVIKKTVILGIYTLDVYKRQVAAWIRKKQDIFMLFPCTDGLFIFRFCEYRIRKTKFTQEEVGVS